MPVLGLDKYELGHLRIGIIAELTIHVLSTGTIAEFEIRDPWHGVMSQSRIRETGMLPTPFWHPDIGAVANSGLENEPILLAQMLIRRC